MTNVVQVFNPKTSPISRKGCWVIVNTKTGNVLWECKRKFPEIEVFDSVEECINSRKEAK